MNPKTTLLGLILIVILLYYDMVYLAIGLLALLLIYSFITVSSGTGAASKAIKEEIEREKKALSHANPKFPGAALTEFGSNLAHDFGNIIFSGGSKHGHGGRGHEEHGAGHGRKDKIKDVPGDLGTASKNFLDGLSKLFGKKIPGTGKGGGGGSHGGGHDGGHH